MCSFFSVIQTHEIIEMELENKMCRVTKHFWISVNFDYNITFSSPLYKKVNRFSLISIKLFQYELILCRRKHSLLVFLFQLINPIRNGWTILIIYYISIHEPMLFSFYPIQSLFYVVKTKKFILELNILLPTWRTFVLNFWYISKGPIYFVISWSDNNQNEHEIISKFLIT